MKLSLRPRNRRLRAPLPLAFLLLLGSGAAVAQSDEAQAPTPRGLTPELSTRPLMILMSINLVTEEGHIFMKMDRSEPTVPGRAVGATLEKKDQLRVEALFTPFWETETGLTLHVQGQIWVADSSGRYGDAPSASAYRAMPVALGEAVLFFPLGAPEQAREWNTRRFRFRTEPIPVDPQPRGEGAQDGPDGPVAILIVMAVQIVPYQQAEPQSNPAS